MKFIDWFAGIGGFRVGMELAGHKCVGFCEIDDNAYRSYIAMHKCTKEDIEYIKSLPMLIRRKEEINKPKYLKGEWYRKDICQVNATEIPDSDIWCFGAPCQDFSLCNSKRKGLDGNKSKLVGEIFRLLQEIPKQNKPRWLVYENVEGMLSSNNGFDFLSILDKMVELGYNCEWQLLNSKDFGVPQNRRRIFVVGSLANASCRQILPIYPSPIKNRNRLDRDKKYIKIKDSTQQGYALATTGDVISLSHPNSTTRRGRVGRDICHTIDTHVDLFVIEDISQHHNKYATTKVLIDNDWYYITMRRITPLECFRLQGFDDIYYERAGVVNGDTALYKQIGNSVTVNIVKEIGKRLK